MSPPREGDRRGLSRELLHPDASVLFGLAAPMALSVLVLACALLTFRAAAFPKWWGIVSVLLGIAMLIPPISWAAMIAFLVWVGVASVLTYTRHTRHGVQRSGRADEHGAVHTASVV